MTDFSRLPSLSRKGTDSRDRFRVVAERYLDRGEATGIAATPPEVVATSPPVPSLSTTPARPILGPGGAELPGDRRRWPEDALAEFWRVVKWLNLTARETGRAVEGRSPFALADAERGVRETWRNPAPLTPNGEPT